jgi:hypothetical protein
MPPTWPIELSLFDFVDDFARQITGGHPKPSEVVEQSAGIVVFCESFFDQLFAQVLDCPITGFDPTSKRKASRLAAGLAGPLAGSPNLRALVALFEGFCDMYLDVIKGSYGSSEITYLRFHDNYMQRLLKRALAWAKEAPYDDLAARIESAQQGYSAAIGAMRW